MKFAMNERSCHGRAGSGGPVVTGLSSRSTSPNQATIRSRNRSAVRGRTIPARRTIRPIRACVRLRGCSAARSMPRCSASSSAPAIHRASAPAAAPVVIGGSRRTTVCPAAVSSGDDGVDRGERRAVGADARHRRAGGDGDAQRPARAAGGAGSSPASTACASARSATVVASAPLTAMPDQSSAPIPAGTTPRPGLSVTSPQAAAGRRSEPMPSLPWASGTLPEATAAALPPELPAGDRAVSQGCG